MERKNLDRWEEKEFLTDWVKHAPAGSLDKSVDDILAELGLGGTPAKPAQPSAPVPQPKPAEPVPQPKPAAPAPQPKPAAPAPQPKPAAPAPQPKPAAPAPQPKPAAPAEQPKPANKPLTPYPRPAKPAPQPAQPVQPMQPEKPVEKPTPAEKPQVPAAAVAEPAPVVRKKRKKDKWIWRFLGNILPKKGDGALELVRKGICIGAIFVLVGSSCVLLNDFVLTPLFGNRLADNIDDMRKKPVDQNADNGIYPAGILDSFKNLYKKNPDTIGWITYKSTSPYWHEKLGSPGYVVVQSNDNDFYLHRDFDKKDDRNGTVFMDYRCKYDTKEDAASGNRITILYGHNMYSGLMFANVNKLLDSLAFAQSAPVVQFSSLFGENNYKVFAIVSNDTSEQGGETFLRTEFSDDKDFLEYVAELRLRSWYNYNDVDVRADDQLLMLYTCSNTYQTTMGKEGRTILVARKVRTGESTEVDISSITENDNKLMPRQWYANNGLELPAYYTSKDAAQAALREILGDDYYADDNNDVTVSSVKKNPVSSKKPKQTPVEEDDYEDDEYYYEEDYDDEDYYYEEDEEDPVVEPVEEDPVVTDPPAEEPVVTDPPVEEPVEEDPVEEDPVEETPVEETPVEEVPAEEPAE